MSVEASDDTLLDGRVRLRQPASGYRAAVDPVLLAAAVPAKPGQRVLDVGCGVGAAALCLLARCPGASVTGLELQPALAALAAENAGANGAGSRFSVVTGDLAHPPAEIGPDGFDHVMANPPYGEAGSGHPPPDPAKAAAHVEGDAGLGDWVGFCLSRVRRKGSVTFIHRADRLDDLLAALHGKSGDIAVFPLWPGGGGPAKRVIVRARKGVASPLRLLEGLVLHRAGGGYSEAADAVLRGGGALTL